MRRKGKKLESKAENPKGSKGMRLKVEKLESKAKNARSCRV
jgi:hypothetical protein